MALIVMPLGHQLTTSSPELDEYTWLLVVDNLVGYLCNIEWALTTRESKNRFNRSSRWPNLTSEIKSRTTLVILVPGIGRSLIGFGCPKAQGLTKRQPKITHTKYIGLVALTHVIRDLTFFGSIGIFFFMCPRRM